jgi:hypothetical protein
VVLGQLDRCLGDEFPLILKKGKIERKATSEIVITGQSSHRFGEKDKSRNHEAGHPIFVSEEIFTLTYTENGHQIDELIEYLQKN